MSSMEIKLIQFTILIITLEFISPAFVPKGRKCRLQEMHCDIMHPDKQCCPGTSCGVKRINNNLVNICMMCLDIGESCGHNSGACCKGLKCQKITSLSSACIPVTDFKFNDPNFQPVSLDTHKRVIATNNPHRFNNHQQQLNHKNNNDDQPFSLASLLMLR